MGGATQALVVAGLVGQVGKQVAQPTVAKPEPAGFGMVAEQDLGDRQAQQLGVRPAGFAAGEAAARIGTQQLVDGDVQCDDEVVEGGVHGASLEVDVADATPTLGGLVSLVTPRPPGLDSELII